MSADTNNVWVVEASPNIWYAGARRSGIVAADLASVPTYVVSFVITEESGIVAEGVMNGFLVGDVDDAA